MAGKDDPFLTHLKAKNGCLSKRMTPHLIWAGSMSQFLLQLVSEDSKEGFEAISNFANEE